MNLILNRHKLTKYYHEALPFLSLLIVVVIFQIATDGQMLSARNIQPLAREVFTMLLGAAGLVFILSQGAFDFSISAGVAFAAAVAAHLSHVSVFLILPAAIAAGLLIGLVNGVIHSIFKVNPFITTLAMSFVLKGVTVIVLRSGSLSVPFKVLQWDTIQLRIAVMLIICAAGYLLFEKNRIGKECKIVGTNPEFARLSGINVTWVKIRGYLIMGTIVGIVAFFSLIRSATASTSTGAGFVTASLNSILLGGMAITGGATSKFHSAVIGAMIMAVLTLGMNIIGIEANVQQLIQGLVFLVAVSMTFDRKNSAVIK